MVFAFDTSCSIGPLEAAVYQALTRFAGDVLPGRETVNILPFGEQLLLEDWTDESYLLQAPSPTTRGLPAPAMPRARS